jgi:hypothetical protein
MLTAVYGPYIYFPLIGGLAWCANILALLLLWVTDGKPKYRGDEASVVFISDVGAVHKVSPAVVADDPARSLTSDPLYCALLSHRGLLHHLPFR